jgi:hypothetical protein
MRLEGKEHVEIAIRSAMISRTLLELLNVHTTEMARMTIGRAQNELQDLAQLVHRIEPQATYK